MRYELVVGAALTYIGATIRSGAMAYPYLLTLKLTRKVLTSSGHVLNSNRALLKTGQDIYGADLTSRRVLLAVIGAE